MRKTLRSFGWLAALGLIGCAGDASEITTLDSLTFTGTGGGNDEETGNADESTGGSATQASADGSSDGGPADSGPADDSASEGGPTDGGPTDGGPTDGGPTDGGPTDGGSTDGGGQETSSDGGASDAGSSSSSDGGGGPTSGGDGGGGGACCDVQMGPGCGDATIEACVCGGDAFCCDTQWDDVCVGEANDNCDAMCDGGGTTGGTDGGGGGTGACCEVQMGPGCDDMTVQDCVCAGDPFCCDTQWDDVCVGEANDNCDAMCDGGTGGTDGGGGGGACCDVQMGPGCDDPTIEDCVCGGDPFCCDTQWDDVCVGEANDCGAMCDGGGGGGGGACCDVQMGPGCGDATIEDCVCGGDPFCCDTQWDDICVGEANDCGAMCGGGGGGGSACCDVQMGPGCGDATIEDCVCGGDPFCCDTQWDDVCVGEAADCGAGC